MNEIHWFCVSNPDGKRFPEWRRSFGVSDVGVVFVPAAMSGEETEMNVMLCACGDGQSTAVHLDHHFVPSDWLKREFPKHFELIEIIEARAQTALGELGQPESAAILD
ncbi:Uncharacterized protein ALO82_02266 [Pseudomonas syringae pv. broussonetiae]|uniref:Uncharacterized protein n=1 Tax=Pseudomonas savastanoi TaxID=29438 RepID=A0A3M5B312_PSESS|nr:hypothetical protein [Pseudomonas savastanoi]KPW65687.1 Uncharacterized protein ALO82_02266 [Pseudomonas syringae pv. broussonetiae]KWT14800.1 hypothetical protein AL047_09070 [Pseudomonas syringae pv. broussonetiae]RMS19722.1 hypothetical protein ALP70_03380 [Pseudomonas savastanoi]RMT21138.1 hypothetical protein ALP51_03392 [Pseudomonas savastanoi]